MHAYAENPPPVPGIVRATGESSRLFDPSITVHHDIRDHEGRLIAKAGTTVNPLDYIALSTTLAFIDGTDETQVAWALAREETTRIVLVNGLVLDLMRTHRRRLYFDQKGLLARHLAITAVPATVEQEGRALRIREFPVDREPAR